MYHGILLALAFTPAISQFTVLPPSFSRRSISSNPSDDRYQQDTTIFNSHRGDSSYGTKRYELPPFFEDELEAQRKSRYPPPVYYRRESASKNGFKYGPPSFYPRKQNFGSKYDPPPFFPGRRNDKNKPICRSDLGIGVPRYAGASQHSRDVLYDTLYDSVDYEPFIKYHMSNTDYEPFLKYRRSNTDMITNSNTNVNINSNILDDYD